MIPVWSGGADDAGRYVQRELGVDRDRWHEASSVGAMVVLGCATWADALGPLFQARDARGVLVRQQALAYLLTYMPSLAAHLLRAPR